jgi:hypothetical protein
MKKSFLVIILFISIVLSVIAGAECRELSVSVSVVDDRQVTGMAVDEPASRLSGTFENSRSYMHNYWIYAPLFILFGIAVYFVIKRIINRRS